MNKKLKILTVSTLIAATIFSTGCSVLFNKPPATDPEPPKIETPDTSAEEDKKVQEFMTEYFGALFGQTVESYAKNLLTGEIPSSISSYIAQRTVKEGNKNPEIGIHLPRIVEVNGMSMLNYEILKDADNKPIIESTFIGKNGDAYLYYVKVGLKAKGLPNSLFIKYYDINNETNAYEKIKENGVEKVVAEEDYDYIKVTAKYDVEIVKDGDSYKVLTQREADYKSPLSKRISKLNNEFVDKREFLDVNIPEQKQQYDNEKALLEQFFNNLLLLDKERMSLLRAEWYKGYSGFMEFLSGLEINKVNGSEILFTDANYTQKFNIMSFPLQVNMDRIDSFDNIKVTQHPGYTQKNKVYFVSFDASVVKANGMIGNKTVYKYDYTVTLKDKNGKLMIDGIKLNEFYQKNDEKPKENKEEKKDTETKKDDIDLK
ncbi:hypothetical protein [Acetivibrio mesophilus]|uniref:Lipoprotein n=1 Tax=Acetivibrio mesophilus TaxID=2487273 RepID=A0A4Q0I6B3_9FIRM|nr:hypothetical protein [Acetivibrio mesophilus]ODM25064.1 hypothetical protein A7W90_01860 [Clostridium sp. Bc-iso-3]RXE59934.1 hypothetical protein EFD62_04060 [Acetivibrio mesophilus]HHV29481.1 hypothetical protein [Clostridium sp.]